MKKFALNLPLGRGTFLITALFSIALLLTACSKLSSKNLEKIQSGMSPDEVKAILGPPTDVQSQGALGFSSTTYTYHTSSADVKIVFLNEKVMAKEGNFK